MTAESPEIEILLGHAGSFRRVPLPALAAVTHLSRTTLHAALSRLLFELLRDRNTGEFGSVGREPTEGGSAGAGPTGPPDSGSAGTEGPWETPEEKNRTGPEPTVPEGGGVPAALTASVLAAALDEPANTAYFDTLLARTDPAIVRRAFDETLTRRHEIRGRPGAYFMAILRRLTNPTPYA